MQIICRASSLAFIERLTKRAPDAGESAQISSSFLRLFIFWLDGFAVPAPAQVTQTVSCFLSPFLEAVFLVGKSYFFL